MARQEDPTTDSNGQKLLDSVTEGVFLLSGESTAITYANDSALKLFAAGLPLTTHVVDIKITDLSQVSRRAFAPIDFEEASPLEQEYSCESKLTLQELLLWTMDGLPLDGSYSAPLYFNMSMKSGASRFLSVRSRYVLRDDCQIRAFHVNDVSTLVLKLRHREVNGPQSSGEPCPMLTSPSSETVCFS